MEKSLMDVVAPLIANRKPTVLRKPCQRALHDPPVSSQFLATLLALSCYAALDMALSEGPFALFVVVGFVGVQQGRLIGSIESISSSKTVESWTFAAVSITQSGMPSRSTTIWRFVPAFPLSVGFGPLVAPPF